MTSAHLLAFPIHASVASLVPGFLCVLPQAEFPGPKSPIPRLLMCGDFTFPGIGVPAVAASGNIAANCLASVHNHEQLLEELGL